MRFSSQTSESREGAATGFEVPAFPPLAQKQKRAKDGAPRFLQIEAGRVPRVSWFGRPGKRELGPRITISFVLKSAQALLLAIAVCFSMGATDSSARVNNLGHRLVCTCSCSELLGECNHVGCPTSGPMLKELSAAIASGATDQEILASFAAKYGVTVLAAPPTHGFSLVAWIAPIAVFSAALLGTILLVRHWSIGRAAAAAPATDPSLDALRERIRRETDADFGGGI